MEKFALVDIIQQPFHSFKEICVSILTTMNAPGIFELLQSGHIFLCPGDHPKQQAGRKILRQGIVKGPKYLAKLLQTSNLTLYNSLKARVVPLCSADECAEVIGKSAMNLRQELGPLHIKLNPPKDIFRTWFDQIFNIAFFVSTGKRMCVNPHLREV